MELYCHGSGQIRTNGPKIIPMLVVQPHPVYLPLRFKYFSNYFPKEFLRITVRVTLQEALTGTSLLYPIHVMLPIQFEPMSMSHLQQITLKRLFFTRHMPNIFSKNNIHVLKQNQKDQFFSQSYHFIHIFRTKVVNLLVTIFTAFTIILPKP